LVKKPEDICLYFDGGQITLPFPTFRSNEIVISRNAIAIALQKAHLQGEYE